MSVSTYQRPVAGKPVTNTIVQNARTPKLKVKFSNVIKPFFYPNSQNVPRFSITCIVDPDQHMEFISKIQKLESSEYIIDSQTLKDDVIKDNLGHIVTSGLHLMKFQTRDRIPVFRMNATGQKTPVNMISEIPYGDEIIIVFDVLRYTKKVAPGLPNKGVSYQPKTIYLVTEKPESEQVPIEQQTEYEF